MVESFKAAFFKVGHPVDVVRVRRDVRRGEGVRRGFVVHPGEIPVAGSGGGGKDSLWKKVMRSAALGVGFSVMTHGALVANARVRREGIGYWESVMRIVRAQGVRGLNEGIVAATANTAGRVAVKGTAYSWMNERDLPVFIKVFGAAGAVTVASTPVERWLQACWAHPKLSKREVWRGIWRNGGFDLYRGVRIDAARNLVDAGLVIGLKELFDGQEGGGWMSLFARSVVAAGVKTGLLTPLEVAKAAIQKEIKPSGEGVAGTEVARTMRGALRGLDLKEVCTRGAPAQFCVSLVWYLALNAMLEVTGKAVEK